MRILQRRSRLRRVDLAAGVFDGAPHELLPVGSVYQAEPLAREFDEDALAVAEPGWKLRGVRVAVPHGHPVRTDEAARLTSTGRCWTL